MKRLTYIFIGIGAVIVIGLTIILIIASRNASSDDVVINFNEEIPYTQDNKIAIDTGQGMVYINDLLKNPVRKAGQKSVVFLEKAEYTMSYYPLPEPGEFIISISFPNPNVVRPQMEKDFLEAVGISETDACKLKVSANVPYAVNPDTAGIDYGLSFCPGGKAL
ncbi:hypothetical protein KKC88_04140 [Patescibacteria group bacterium]|nr:hypothetical protein [Patescibacteria group bacterium]MBU1673159.1 hypothetical protein [Patescibacteria group bacterium]MBU1964156.1 hypothetical protein [Patescibacteria group bacterium]